MTSQADVQPLQPIHLHRSRAATAARPGEPCARWPVADIQALFDLPFNDLLYLAQRVHRQHFDPAEVELATLLSIKTGGCPEDCRYCPQSAHYDTGVEAGPLMHTDSVRAAAAAAKSAGATRFCMGAAWRAPRDQIGRASCRERVS
jgi:biotin synthase